MSYSDGARASNWADLDKSLEVRRIGDSVWLLMWRDYTHSASGHNRAIKLMDERGRIVRNPEYLQADEVFEVPNGWSYFIDSIQDPQLHEVNYQEYQVGDLLVRDDDVLVILDVYDDNEDIYIYSMSEKATYVENIEDLFSKNWKVISLDDLVL
jgi:hypothetical protein|nr:MAG TPA: hypothetical protein [Myoviridae sp. ctTS62]